LYYYYYKNMAIKTPTKKQSIALRKRLEDLRKKRDKFQDDFHKKEAAKIIQSYKKLDRIQLK